MQNETESAVNRLGITLKSAIKNIVVQNTHLKYIQQRIYVDDNLDVLESLKGIAHTSSLTL